LGEDLKALDELLSVSEVQVVLLHVLEELNLDYKLARKSGEKTRGWFQHECKEEGWVDSYTRG
jgi:hypothetical protein